LHSEIKLQELIEDYDRAFEPPVSIFGEKAETLKLIQAALQLSAHILERDKTQLAGQLLGRLLDFPNPEIQAILAQAKQWQKAPWLRSLNASLIPPNGILIRTLMGHSDRVTAVAITPDGQRLISGSQDGAIKIWNLETEDLICTISAHNDSVNTIAITPDGSHIISGSQDGTIKIWNLETEKLIDTLTGHYASVNAVALTPDSSVLISASSDCCLKVWNLKTGKELHTLIGHRASVQAVTVILTNNNKWVISGSYNDTLRVWNLETGKAEFTLGNSDMVYSLAATHDGERVISASQDGTLSIWKVRTWEKEYTLKGHSQLVRSVAVTPDGKQIISGSSDGTLKIWKIGTWENEGTFTDETASVLAITVTPDGKQIISASENNLKIWNIEKCRTYFSFNNERDTKTGHSDSVEVIAFTPDEKKVISVSQDRTCKIWKVETWENKATFTGQINLLDRDYGSEKYFDFKADEIKCFLHSTRNTLPFIIATTADGKRQILAKEDETLEVWDVSASQYKYIASFTGESEIKSCAIASDGVTIVAGEASGRMHFLRLEGVGS
jgi:WD40 repeat protein